MKSMIDKSVESRVIDYLRFFMILLVVCIHTPEYSVESTSLFWSGFVDFIVNYIARTAVPIFFVVSSYLFFLNNDFSFTVYSNKVKRRIKTLLVPYLIWNAMLIIAFVLRDVDDFSGDSIFDTISNLCCSFFDYKSTKGPIAFQFWFIRDLMILNLFSPVVFYLLKNKIIGHFLVIAIGILWLVFGDGSVHIMGISAIFFYILGAWLCVNGISFCHLGSCCGGWPWLYVPLVLLDFYTNRGICHGIFHNFVILTGCFFAVRVTYVMCKRFFFHCTPLVKSSFFIFAFHVPWGLSVSKKMIECVPLLCRLPSFFTTLILCLAISIAFFYILSKLAPNSMSLLMGNRVGTQS